MRKFIRSVLQRFGYDIIKHKPRYIRGKLDEAGLKEEYKWLQEYSFKTIIDIGANEGQFSDRIRLLFPGAFLHAFEPLPGVFHRLQENFRNDPAFRGYNLGIGDRKGELELVENDYSPSSSFLKMTSSHTSSFETAVETKKVAVSVERLDDIFAERQIDGPLLIKIDVQGFEDKVLAGGAQTFRKATLVICELSFVELYEGQPLFADLFARFSAMGFAFAGVVEQLRSPATNRILQADGIFIKM
jgi:FkbM family methyltransferase